MSDEPSPKQVALLIALRELERDDAPVDFAKLAARSGYSEASVRTYFTKRLEGFVAFRDGERWAIRGATRITEEAFARRLSQNAASANEALKTEATWQALLRKLLYEGQRRHYHLSREEIDLIEALRPPRREPTDEVLRGEIQPSLFRKPR
jgi:hypothetical protein